MTSKILLVLSIIAGFFIPLLWILSLLFGYWVFVEERYKKNLEAWVAALPDVQYKHSYIRSGIALDTANKRIYLKEGPKEKSYSFSEIKTWRYNIASGGELIGGGMKGVTHNVGNRRRNMQGSGFFVSVRDIDNPEWQVAFKYKSGIRAREMEIELKKWMEIFDQCVNNN